MQYCSLQHWILLSSPVKMKVAQSCPTLCNPLDDISMEFSRPEYWSGYLSLLEGILNEQCFLFGPATSFFLGPLVVLLHFSLVPYRTPSDLGDSSCGVISFCPFIQFMKFSWQVYWSGLPFPPPVDHILSELSAVTHPSWVALHSTAHSFNELCKPLHHDKAVNCER